MFDLVTKSQAQQKYLFLNTLREVILNNSGCLIKDVGRVQDLLMSQAGHEEESIRSIVAESLGRLFSAYPQQLIASVDDGLLKGNSRVKATIAKSVKYSGQTAKRGEFALYTRVATSLIQLSKESDPDVKKNALEGLTTIVHTNWQIVRESMADLLNFAF